MFLCVLLTLPALTGCGLPAEPGHNGSSGQESGKDADPGTDSRSGEGKDEPSSEESGTAVPGPDEAGDPSSSEGGSGSADPSESSPDGSPEDSRSGEGDPGSDPEDSTAPDTSPEPPSSTEFVEPAEVPMPAALYPNVDVVTDCLSYCVIDDDGRVWLAKNSSRHLAPASTTKVMTALVTAEHVASLDEEVRISEAAVNAISVLSSGVVPPFRPGEVLNVRELLYALELPSTNVAGNVLAEYVAGSTEAFAALMNEKAATLGLYNTHFENAHGLDGAHHYSCAYDLAVILKAALQNPVARDVLSTIDHVVPATAYASARELRVGHRILNGSVENNGAFAGKNGWTYGAQGTLVTAYERNGKRFYIAVQHSDEGLHYLDTVNLADAVYSLYESNAPADITAYDMALETAPEVMDVRVTESDESGMTVSFRLNRAAAASRVIWWNQAYGHTTAVFEETGRGDDGQVSYRIPSSGPGLYSFQVYARDAAGRENGIGHTLLYTGSPLAPESITAFNGQTYFVSRNGELELGFIELPGGCYYASPETAALVYESFVEDGLFYVGADGLVVRGWQTIGGNTYYFQSDGSKVSGKYLIDGTEYTFSPEGILID